MIEGIGKDAEIVVNKNGGKQSKSPFRFDLIPPEAMFKLAEVLAYGAERYTPNNWRLIPRHKHLNHALVHAFAYMAGDTTDEHFEHFLCRVVMAASVKEQEGHSYTEYKG